MDILLAKTRDKEVIGLMDWPGNVSIINLLKIHCVINCLIFVGMLML